MSVNRGMDKEDMVHICNGKNETMPFEATSMDLEIIILSKSHREREIS